LRRLLCLVLPGQPRIAPHALAESFTEDWLPEQVDGWQRRDHRAEERDRSSNEGQFSRTWVYQRRDRWLTAGRLAARVGMNYNPGFRGGVLSADYP
jgi:hypothetical protein